MLANQYITAQPIALVKLEELQSLQIIQPDLNRIQQQGLGLMNLYDKGQELADKAAAIAKQRNTKGKCYAAVADAVDATTERFLWGMSAYQAADQFANNSHFREK